MYFCLNIKSKTRNLRFPYPYLIAERLHKLNSKELQSNTRIAYAYVESYVTNGTLVYVLMSNIATNASL